MRGPPSDGVLALLVVRFRQLGGSACRRVSAPRLLADSPEPLEDRAQASGGLLEIFGQHARIPNHRHEIGVAVPARDQMHVNVIEDLGRPAGAGIDGPRRKTFS